MDKDKEEKLAKIKIIQEKLRNAYEFFKTMSDNEIEKIDSITLPYIFDILESLEDTITDLQK